MRPLYNPFNGAGSPENPNRRPASPRTPRPCIKCREGSPSIGSGHRECPRCAGKNARVPKLGGSSHATPTAFGDDERE